MTTVTWSRMRTFLAVIDHGGVRAAAASLHVTESAVSAAVAHLESHLGTDLLLKDGRGVRPSESGLVYARYSRTILGLVAEAEAAVLTAEQGRLRIGAVATASEHVLPRLLASFRRRFPEVELSLSVRPRDDLFAELHRHETDLVLAGRPPRGSGLVTQARRDNTLIVVGAPGGTSRPLDVPWLLRGPGSGTRDAMLGLLSRLEAEPPTLTLGTHGAVVAAAKEGLGLTLAHADAVAADLRAGTIEQVAVPGTPLERPWYFTTSDTPTRSTLLFLRHVTQRDDVGAEAFDPAGRLAG